ncbi:MAG: DNRLRE domain-containing protein [Deltaproteobacteria bacterium]|nr:DNRLRE domain-containing protein [Deltaproteobacteria bacterium]
MKRLIQRLETRVAAAALVGMLALPGGARALTAPAAGDAFTVSTMPTTNKGTATSLEVASTVTTTKIAYMQFDLSTLPSPCSGLVNQAKLRLFLKTVLPTATGGDFDVYRVTSAWAESTIKASVVPTLAVSPDISTVHVGVGNKTDFLVLDVTGAVQDWCDTPASNYGLALVAQSGLTATFDSKESTSTSQAPQLEVVLSSAGPGTIQNTDINFESGVNNIAVGPGTLSSNTTGANNMAVGDQALNRNTTGNYNTGAGNSALYYHQTGDSNTAVGHSTLASNVSGSRNTALGAWALFSNPTASDNTAIGYSALRQSNGASTINTAVGSEALRYTTSGDGNTALGAFALKANTDGGSNTAVGNEALKANTSGGSNTAVGDGALFANTADTNTALGAWGLRNNTTGFGNTAVGSSALWQNTTGDLNTAVGSNALQGNTTGQSNTALGYDALLNAGGDNNTAVGVAALAYSDGSSNTGVGRFALRSSTAGYENTALGHEALDDVTTGYANLALGRTSGNGLVSGSNNIYIDAGAGSASESNTIRIGSSGHTATYIGGIYSPTVSTRAVYVNSLGQLGTISSSQRFKTDIRSIGGVGSKVLQLRPVSFHYKKEYTGDQSLQYGLIAEEVARVFPELADLDSDGKPVTVRYHLLSVLLLNELQKQHHTQEALLVEVAQQQQTLDRQLQYIAELRQQNDDLRSVRAENAQLRAQLDEIGALKARLAAVEAVLPAADAVKPIRAAAAQGY